MSTEIHSVIEELGQAFESFKSANDDRIKALEKRTTDPVATDQIERLTGIMMSLNGKLDHLRQEAKMKAISDRPVLSESARSADIERKAFSEYLRTGNTHLLQELETKVFDHNDGSGQALMQDGKIVLPKTLQMQAQTILELHCPVIKLAHNVTGHLGFRAHVAKINPKTFDPFKGEKAKDRWKNEALDDKDIQISKVEIKPHHVSFTEKVSLELVDTIQDLLLPIWSQGFGHMMNRSFLHGADDAEPTGMLVDMFSDADADNKCLALKTGSDNAIGSDKNIIGKILQMQQQISLEYRKELNMMAHSETIAKLMAVQEHGKYAYSATDQTFLGIKLHANDEMKKPSENDLPHIVMANYSEFYAYLLGPITIWVDRKTHDGMPRITAQYMAGGAPIHTKACVGLTFKA